MLNLRAFRKLNISSQLSCLVGDSVIIYPIHGNCFLWPEMEVGHWAGCLLLLDWCGLESPRKRVLMRNCLNELARGHIFQRLSWLLVEVGRHSPLWAAQFPRLVIPNRRNLAESKQAASMCLSFSAVEGRCVRSCLDFPCSVLEL